jgi:hypothetical protein
MLVLLIVGLFWVAFNGIMLTKFHQHLFPVTLWLKRGQVERRDQPCVFILYTECTANETYQKTETIPKEFYRRKK